MYDLETMKKMNGTNESVTINVGLNVGNTEPEYQLGMTVGLLRLKNYKITEGEWDGIKERVVVAEMPANFEMRKLIDATVALRQDAIAVKTKNSGYLVTNPTREVDISYDSNFFIDF